METHLSTVVISLLCFYFSVTINFLHIVQSGCVGVLAWTVFWAIVCTISQNMHGAGSGDASLKCQPGADKEEFLFILPPLSSKFSFVSDQFWGTEQVT